MLDPEMLRYIARLETMAFFAAFIIVYSIVISLPQSKLIVRARNLLPATYLAVCILYLGMVIDQLHTQFTLNAILSHFNQSWTHWFALIPLVFFVKKLRKYPIIAAGHSGCFFQYLVVDLYQYSSHHLNYEVVTNDLKVVLDSFLLNGVLLILITGLTYLPEWLQKFRRSKNS